GEPPGGLPHAAGRQAHAHAPLARGPHGRRHARRHELVFADERPVDVRDQHRVPHVFSRTAPNVSADRTYRCASSSSATGTSAETTPMAASWFHTISNSVTKLHTPIEKVWD